MYLMLLRSWLHNFGWQMRVFLVKKFLY